MNETIRTIGSRRSVRAFLPDEIAPAQLDAIFALAARAPSNCNTQPWQVEVVSGAARERLGERLRAAAEVERYTLDFPFDENAYTGLYGERRRAQGASYHQSLGVARDDIAGRKAAVLRNLDFFGAPHVALLFMPAFGGMRVAADIGMYAQNLLLAIESHGAASCSQTILGFFADDIRDALGVDDDMKLLFGISFGFADPDAPQNAFRIDKAPLEQTTRFHR